MELAEPYAEDMIEDHKNGEKIRKWVFGIVQDIDEAVTRDVVSKDWTVE